ncbi:hypothetical protein V6R21_08270 [Limibacter armeniacum]|uniref:hypothetical protein n=1 Tax=Limibacter armeniacum TaxID=466084 RepID=UPI002FE502F3
MSEAQIAAIWQELTQREDMLAVSDLHYLKVTTPEIPAIFLIVWDSYQDRIKISKVQHVCNVDDEPIDISGFNYVMLKHKDIQEQVLLKITVDSALQKLHAELIFHPKASVKKLDVLYL